MIKTHHQSHNDREPRTTNDVVTTTTQHHHDRTSTTMNNDATTITSSSSSRTNPNHHQHSYHPPPPPYRLGQFVTVQSRTGPGINQPGGIARITQVTTTTTIAVKYVLDGRHESHLDVRYVQPYTALEDDDEEKRSSPTTTTTLPYPRRRRTLRDRNLLLGRCPACGSFLRTDCRQSCPHWSSSTARLGMPKERRTGGNRSSDDDDSSTSSREYDRMIQEHRRAYRRYQRFVEQQRVPEHVRPVRHHPPTDSLWWSLCNDQEEEVVEEEEDRLQRGSSSNRTSSTSSNDPLLSLPPPTPRKEQSRRQTSSIAMQGDRDTMDDMIRPNGDDDLHDNNNDNDDDEHEHDEPQRRFIQPEGSVGCPDDVPDRTQSLSYPQLVTLLQDHLHRMTTVDVPRARQELHQLERQYQRHIMNTNNNNSHSDNNNDPSPDRRSRMKSLRRQCQAQHDAWIQRLVRDGYDQCQLAYRKLTSRKFYQSYLDRHHDDDEEVVPFLGRDDTREFALDAVNQDMEEILSKFRGYSKSLQSLIREEEEEEASDTNQQCSEHTSSDDDDEEEGSSSDTSQLSFHQQLLASNSQTFRDASKTAPADQHPFASKKRRRKLIITAPGNKKSKKPRTTTGREIHRRNIDRPPIAPDLHDHDDILSIGFDLNHNTDDDSVDILYEDDVHSARRRRHRPTSIRPRRPHRDKKPFQAINERRREDSTNETWNEASVNENAADSHVFPPPSMIPDIENILRPTNHIETKRNQDTDGALSKRSKQNQPVSDRMQKWLQANDYDLLNLDEGKSDDSQQVEGAASTRRRYRREYRNGRRRDISKKGTNTSNSVVPTAATTIDETKSLLFSALFEHRSNDTKTPSARPSNLLHVCSRIESNPSDMLLRTLLDELCAWFEDDDEDIATAPDATLAFHTTIDWLCRDGTTTLQDLVSNESPELDRFVSVLVSILVLLRRKVNHRLTADDGVLFEIFGKDKEHIFLEFCLLQFVDTVMSLFQPTAWALHLRDVRKVLRQLEPLRNEIARHVQLTERVCGILLKELPPQEWRCVRGGKSVFVSSINPDDWEALLSTGKQPQKPTTVRFAAFENVIPRCEVDAIWCTLAFFAGIETSISSTDNISWSLLSQLLFKGSLSHHEPSAQNPPEAEQVDAAIEDIKEMTYLIMSGSMGTLPRRDNMLLDVIQKALLLESDYLLSLEDPHETPLQSLKRKQGLDIIAFLQEDTPFASAMTVDGDFNSFIKELCETTNTDFGTKQLIPLPSSRMLRSCLALLLAWRRQIPQDKVKRLQCLVNAVKSCARQISIKCIVGGKKTEMRDGFQERDAFSEAFQSSTKETESTDAATLLCKESTVYLTIFVSASFECGNSTWMGMHLRDEESVVSEGIWELLSNEAMQQRRQWIVSCDFQYADPLPSTCCVDASSLLITAKAVALVGFMLIGKDPLSFDVLTSVLTTDGCTTITKRFSAIKYVISCLVVCIDTACDMEYKPETLSTMSLYVSFVLKALDYASRHCSCVSIQVNLEMKSIAMLILKARFIQRGLSLMLGASSSAVTDGICFRSFVTVIRSVLKLCCSERVVESSLSQIEETTSLDAVDAFDDIDDDALANIDLDLQGLQPKVTVPVDYSESFYSICNMLTNYLEASKPSNRTAITSNDPSDISHKISSHGVKLVNKHSKEIFHIIADIYSVFWRPQCPIKMPWNNIYNLRDLDDIDNAEYFRNLSKAINCYLCQRYDLVIVQDMVRSNVEPFMFCCLESTMNHALIRKLPSCNLNRIGNDGATLEGERAFSELVDFRNGRLLRLNEGLTEVQEFCGNLSRILTASDDGDSAEISNFAKLTGDIFSSVSTNTENAKLVPSLERECFRRFIFFRRLISETANARNNIHMFERLSVHLLSICTNGLLKVLEKIVILDQALLNVKGHMYERSKLYETVSCLVELHVCVVVEILRCRYNMQDATSHNFDVMMTYILDDFVAAIVSGKYVTPLTSLRNLAGNCTSFLSGQSPKAHREGGSTSSSFDMKSYCNQYQNALVRRSRELFLSMDTRMIGSAVIVPSTLILGLLHVTGGGNDVAAILGLAYTASSFYKQESYLQIANSTCRSPLEIAIDDHYAAQEESEQLTVAQMKHLHELKMYTLSKVVVPALAGECVTSTFVANKVRLFQFIQLILSQDQDHRLIGIDEAGTFDVNLLCAIVKQIGVALGNEVLYSTKCTVNESLVEMMFTCGRSVLVFPSEMVEPESIGRLVHWACPSTRSTDSTHSDYIWYTCGWIRSLGEMISSIRNGQLHKLRQDLLDDGPNANESFSMDHPIWIPLGGSAGDKEHARHLNELEERVFPKPVMQQPKFLKANKYVTGRTQHRTGTIHASKHLERRVVDESTQKLVSFDDWTPSATLCSAICQFQEEIQLVTPPRESLRSSSIQSEKEGENKT